MPLQSCGSASCAAHQEEGNLMIALRNVRPLLMLFAFATPAFSQTKPAADKPADSMQILREKLQADKKLLIAANMDLTEAEAKNFWPIYEAYQKDLHKINDQIAMTLVAYAKEYNAKSLTDAKARQLLDQSIAIDESEVRLKKSYVPKLAKVLPGRKVARYLQLENKVRALVRYEIAGEVPLAP
jgi:hypothetical protein